jgi:hypothetical protein
MSQRITKKRETPKPAPRNNNNVVQITEAERLLEIKARFQMEAAEARRKFTKDMIMVVAAAFAVVTACVISIFLICYSPNPGDRQTGIIMLGQIVNILFTAVYGRTFSLKA